MASQVSVSLLDHFAALSDPRQHAKVLVSIAGNSASGFGFDDRRGGRLRGDDAVGKRASGVPATLLPLRKRHPQPRYAV